MDYWFILFKYLQHKYELLNLKTKNCKTNNRKLFYLLLGKNKHKRAFKGFLKLKCINQRILYLGFRI